MSHTPTLWTVDYPGAIQVEAAQYGYLTKNNPKAWCLHTPEEPADATPSTPYFFHNIALNSSTHYFVSFLGFVFQMVPESEGAYANSRNTGTRFSWETPANLNLQTINVEIEGFAHNITQTMPRGSIQWRSLIRLLAHRCKALGFAIERMFGHKAVSSSRTDPGALRLDWVVQDVNKLLDEGDDDMPLNEEDKKWIKDTIHAALGIGNSGFMLGNPKDTNWKTAANLPAWIKRHLNSVLDNSDNDKDHHVEITIID